MQAAFQEIFNSPGQMQRLYAAFSSQPTFPISETGADHNQATSQLTSYDPFHDPSRMFQDESSSSDLLNNRFSAMDMSKSLDAITPHDPLVQGTVRLHKSSKDAQDIDNHVNALNTSINSLIESLGLEPTLLNSGSNTVLPTSSSSSSSASSSLALDPTTTTAVGGGVDPVVESSSVVNPIIGSALAAGANDDIGITPELDYNAFLNEFSGATDYGDQLDSTAFLDEVNSVDDGATPAPSLRGESPSVPTTIAATTPVSRSPTSTGRKRKSDVMELDLDHTKTMPAPTANNLGSTTKTKRKR
jgi:hypothetical protein